MQQGESPVQRLMDVWMWVPRVLSAVALGLRLRRLAAKAESVGDLVDIAMSTRILGLRIAPLQMRDELIQFMQFVKDSGPKTVLEIGTAKGGTLFLLCQVCPADAVLISLDVPGGGFGAGYRRWKKGLYKSFAREHQTLHLVEGNSHDEATRLRLQEVLEGRSLDLLFIDGDHTYKGVSEDFLTYSEYARDDGIIAFHDITPGPEADVGDVPRFWSEVSARFQNRTITSSQCAGGFGIGLLWREPAT